MVLTAITDTVRAVAAGAAQRAVKDAAEGVRTIAGLNPEGSNSKLGATANLTGDQKNNSYISYPINVDSDEQQGHYVVFHIHTRSNGKLLAGDRRKDMSEAVKKLEKEMGDNRLQIKKHLAAKSSGISSGPRLPGAMTGGAAIGQQKIDKFSTKKIEGRNNNRNASLMLQKLPTVQLEQSIALYMPPNVQVSYDIKYADKEIGSLAMAGSSIIDEIKKANDFTSGMQGIFDSLTGMGREAGLSALGKALDVPAPGASALIQMATGSVVTPRMEMMFEGVGRRSFTYTFNFIPKSQQEALVVKEIIKKFKFYAMPKYSNPQTRREMDIPGTFKIEYMYRSSRNQFLNKVHTCFLTKVDVQYGGDRYTAYDNIPEYGPPPQKSTLTLNFTELEVLSQDHIELGF